MVIDRTEILREIKASLERKDDEYTAKELSDGFDVQIANLHTFMDDNDIEYTRRKAIADGRRQYVYKIERTGNGN